MKTRCNFEMTNEDPKGGNEMGMNGLGGE